MSLHFGTYNTKDPFAKFTKNFKYPFLDFQLQFIDG